MKRALVAILLGLASPLIAHGADANRSVTVYKTPTCGCCKHWVTHLEENGFSVDTVDRPSLDDVKRQHGVTPRLSSCHTGVAGEGRYAFEGHVPAYLVARFLDDPPEGARGLTVPGMPVGSPGMEMGDRFRAYDVLLMKSDGSVEVYEAISEIGQQHPAMH